MSPTRFNRRTFLKASAASALLAACQNPGAESKAPQTEVPKPAQPAPAGARVVVLGFDGVDPRLVERFLASGDLPEIARLAKQGWFGPLVSTSPPNSPVAWSSFATGLDPGEHGIFGFLQRSARTYLPGTAPYTVSGPRFGPAGMQPPSAVSNRRGEDFWLELDRAGVKTGMLWMPYSFPPPALRHGRVLSGLGVPDARFTNSSFTLFTSEPAGRGESDSVAGGRIERLALKDKPIETRLEGPRGPDDQALSAPLSLEPNRKQASLAIGLGGKREVLREGQRSGWFPVRFEAQTPQGAFVLTARVRFHLLSVRKSLKLYASPLQIDPGQALLPIGAPADWLVQAIQTHSLPTVGWVHDTSAVNAGVLPKQVFLADLLDTMQARASLLYQELESGFAQVQLAVFTATDRAAHMFYRELSRPDGGPIKAVYQAMDRIIGQVRKRLSPGTRLVILSDHGFHPFDRQLHVNTWLEELGLFQRAQPGGAVDFLRGVDWSASRAYSMGNGQVYANLKGREGQGVVAPGTERAQLLETIRDKLLALVDPVSGARPVRAVYPVADRAAPAVADRAPDLQIAFAPGWRSSWESSLGGAPTGAAMVDNPKAWCGDHAASDVAETPGILLADAAPGHTDPNIKDLGASVLRLAGVNPTGPGRPLWK